MTPDGEETGTSYSGAAPLTVRFLANPEHTEGWTAHYEWRFSLEEAEEPYLIRYEGGNRIHIHKGGTS